MKKLINILLRKLFIKFLYYNPDIINDIIDNNILKRPKVYGLNKNIKISPLSKVCNGLFNSASGKIEIKDYVFFGHNVSVIAARHDYTKFREERIRTIPINGHDIIVEEGAWICSNVTLVGPCCIGKNSVVLPGSVVVKDIGENEVHGGVPARFIKKIK
jgi:acetyltransferase-like isoleucine patch superfamily enzyme